MENYLQSRGEDLFRYEPPLTRERDFDEFWEDTIARAKSVPLRPERVPCDYPSPYVDLFEISYNGFDETRIHGWLMLPRHPRGKLPCLISYHGYQGNRGFPADLLKWASLGIASLSVDCRAQSGKTGNCAHYSSGNEQSVVTLGLLDREEYYYRQVYMDALKAIDFACSREELDGERIIINGSSQGGAIALAVCALDSRPFLCTADVPSNSNITERVAGRNGSFQNVTEYLRKHPYETDRVLSTLSYFDLMNLADRIRCPVLASVGLQDTTCPARHFFAAYNRIGSEKRIEIYPFNNHEGGGGYHNELKMGYIMDRLSLP